MMKYTVNIIDTEEKFREKFGTDPQWTISTPYGRPKKSIADKTVESKTKSGGKQITNKQ
jgi:hypothetical protein